MFLITWRCSNLSAHSFTVGAWSVAGKEAGCVLWSCTRMYCSGVLMTLVISKHTGVCACVCVYVCVCACCSHAHLWCRAPLCQGETRGAIGACNVFYRSCNSKSFMCEDHGSSQPTLQTALAGKDFLCLIAAFIIIHSHAWTLPLCLSYLTIL